MPDAESLKELDAVDHIRLRPGMYIGSQDEAGVEHLIYELVANSIDCFLTGQATWVGVAVDDQTHAITVSDDGPGLPFDRPVPSGKSLAEIWLQASSCGEDRGWRVPVR